MQVDFLNSVIVDQQRKNEALKSQLEVMESSSLSLSSSITDTLVKYVVFSVSCGPVRAPGAVVVFC